MPLNATSLQMSADLNPFDTPSRAFISYARSDGEEIAAGVRARLEAEYPEITLWLDRAQMVAGVGWWKQITDALDRVEILIMVMTPAATRSGVAAKEWRYARQQGVRVCPVFQADSKPDFEALPGWMRKAHFYDLEKEWATFVAFLQSAKKANRVPFMAPDPPETYVPRPEQVEAVLHQLLDESGENPRAVAMALHGAGGFGKTTCAVMICHAEKIITAFDDGVLWVRLGETPNIQGEITKLYAALTGERPSFVDADDASIQLAERLDQKNCLLVIDDVWDPNHLGPFMRGGSRCSRLVTTRQLSVVTELGSNRMVVDKMTSDQAVAMLTAKVEVAENSRDSLCALAARLGEWPLLLKLAASQLSERIVRGDTLDGALAYIGRALDKKGVVAFDRTNPSARNDAIASTVRASLELFSKNDQDRYCKLAVLRGDVLIPLRTLRALWKLDEFDTEELVQRLDGAALLDFDLKTGGIRLHAVLRSYLETRIEHPTDLHLQLAEEWLRLPYELPDAYAWAWIGWHLERAQEKERLRSLLLDFDWLRARLKAIPVQFTLQDFEGFDDQKELTVVRDALRLASQGLSFDPEQLRLQILGRIDRGRSAALDRLLDRAEQSDTGHRLALLGASLTHPGGALTGILKSHGGGVHALAISGDGRWAIVGSQDWTLRLWDLQASRVVRAYEGHKGVVHSVAFTPDGRSFLSASEDRTLRLWDIETAQVLKTYRGHTLAVQGVAVSGDGRVAATVSEDGSVRIWDLASKVTQVVYKGRDHQLSAVVISRDGHRIVFGAGDWTLRSMDLRAGTARTLQGHEGIVRAIALTPDESTLVSGADDGVLRTWAMPDSAQLHALTGHTGAVEAVAVTPDGRRVVSGARDKTLRVWDLDTGEGQQILTGHSGFIRALAVSSMTGQVVSGSTDKTIRQWDVDAESREAATTAHGSAVSLLSLSTDGGLAISGEQNATPLVWSLDASDRPRAIGHLDGHGDRVQALEITGDGERAVTGSRDRTLRSWRLATCSLQSVFAGHSREVLDIDVSADGSRLLSFSRDRTIRVWDAETGQCLRALVSEDNRAALSSLRSVNAMLAELNVGPQVDVIGKRIPRDARIAIAPNGELAILGFQGNICAWDLTNGTAKEQDLADVDIVSISFDPQSARVVLGSLFGQVVVWDLENAPRVLGGQEGAVLDCVVTADGKHIITAARDSTIFFRDGTSLQRVGIVSGHSAKADTVVIAPNGSFAFCVYGESLLVYDLRRSLRLSSLSFDHQITTIAVTPAGDRIAIGDQSGQVHFLDRIEP